MEFIYLIAGIVIGGTAIWLVSRANNKGSLMVGNEKALFLTNENEKLRGEITSKDNALLEINRKLASRESDYQHLTTRLNDQKAEIEKLQEKFTIEFKNLANDILDEKTKKFTEQNKTNL